jgi:2-haloacid dehalogenase
MATFKPKFITFDCYGTLTNFDMAGGARQVFADRLDAATMDAFVEAFRGYRLDEVVGPWKPFREVVCNSIERTCKRIGIKYDRADGERIYQKVPTWGPHPDVTAGLSKIAGKIPLVILSNASNDQIHTNVKLLGVPFDRVLTAQDAGAYKPRYRAFEYMLDVLGCGPEDILHVSSSFRYDLMPAYDLGIKSKAWVNRGHEPATPFYQYAEIPNIGGLPGLVGL